MISREMCFSHPRAWVRELFKRPKPRRLRCSFETVIVIAQRPRDGKSDYCDMMMMIFTHLQWVGNN